jgi:YHS domain-containing protein
MKLKTILVPAMLLCLLGPAGCDKGESSNPPEASGAADTKAGAVSDDAPVVENTEAKPGDVTVCPYSGKKFVVKAEHPTMQWGEKTYVFCSDFAKQEVEKDPEKYLGPAT